MQTGGSGAVIKSSSRRSRCKLAVLVTARRAVIRTVCLCVAMLEANFRSCRCSRSARAYFSELDVIMRAGPTDLGGLHAVPACRQQTSPCADSGVDRDNGRLGRLARLPGSFHLATGLPIPG
jgi:hypothetical protein